RPRPLSDGLGRLARPALWCGAGLLLLVAFAAAYLWLPPLFLPREPSGGSAGREELPPGMTLREFFQRERPLGVRTPLLRGDFQPVRGRILWGKGHYLPAPASELVLYSPSDNVPTVLGLDYPSSRSFEFLVEMRQADRRAPNQNDLGIVFGWHD